MFRRPFNYPQTIDSTCYPLDFAGKEFQGTNQLASVRHFIVVPSNGFHQLFVANSHHAGLSRIEE